MIKTNFSISFLSILLACNMGAAFTTHAQECSRDCTYFETTDFPDLKKVTAEIKTYLRKNATTLTPDCNRRLHYLLAVIYEATSSQDSASYHFNMQSGYSKSCSSDTAKIEAYLHSAGFMTRNFKNAEANSLIDSALMLLRDYIKKEHFNYNFEQATAIYTTLEDSITAPNEWSGVLLKRFPATIQTIFRKYYQAKGNVAINTSDNAEARANLLLAYQFAKVNASDSTEGNISNNLGLLFSNEGYYQKAVEFLNESLLLFERQNNYPAMPKTLINLSYCYRKMKAYKEAETYAAKAITISIENGYTSSFCRASGFLARALSLQNKMEEAELVLQRSIDTARYYKNNIELCYNLRALAEVFLQHRIKLSEAKELALESRQLALQTKDSGFLSSIDISLGNYYFITKSYPQALQYTLQSLSINQEYTDAGELEVANKQLADIYEAAGNHKEAIYYYKRYVRIKDSLLNREVALMTQDLESKYNNKSKALQIVQLEKDKKEKEVLLKEKNNRIRLFTFIALITLSGVLLFLYINRKLSAQKKQVELVNQQLQDVTSLQNHLFRIIAHDFKSMVFPFNRAGKIMRSYFDKNDMANASRYAENLEENAVRLSGTINNLLFWSAQQMDGLQLKKEKIWVRENIEEVIQTFVELIRLKNIDIVNLVPKEETIFADKEAFQLIIRNIVSNAVKFTENAPIVFFSEQENGFYTIAIADNGRGMSEQKVLELFNEPLQQTTSGTRGEKGSGLGFSIIKKLVALNSGKLFLESELTKGTTVCIRFQQK